MGLRLLTLMESECVQGLRAIEDVAVLTALAYVTVKSIS